FVFAANFFQIEPCPATCLKEKVQRRNIRTYLFIITIGEPNMVLCWSLFHNIKKLPAQLTINAGDPSSGKSLYYKSHNFIYATRNDHHSFIQCFPYCYLPNSFRA